MTTRVFDLDEVARLLKPFIHYEPNLTMRSPDNRLDIQVTLRSQGRDAGLLRLGAVEHGNDAIAALEDAGYEHASPPEIDLGGIEVTGFAKEACDYIVHAEMHLELIGKRVASEVPDP